MGPDRARQAEQLERPVQRQFVNVLRDRGALGFLALPKLDVWAEPADTAGDLQAGFGVLAQFLILRFLAIAARLRELAGELALRIVRAGDKGAITPAAQAEAPFPALGAHARVGPIILGREEVVGEELVELLSHFRGLLLHQDRTSTRQNSRHK